jgi:hypothetical protein
MICSICCGTEREVTVNCPLDCEYLRDARRHEKPTPHDSASMPEPDIRVTDDFLRDHDELLMVLAEIVSGAALETAGAVDFDVRDTLAALVRTYRTLETGVLYETLPDNALAARLFRTVQERIATFRSNEQRNLGMPKTRDAEILQCLVFFERVEFDSNNGRRRGRTFIDLLRSLVRSPERPPAAPESLLVLP